MFIPILSAGQDMY